MADFNAAVMTNSGIELLSRTLAGQAKIKFTVLKAGNGIYTAEEKERSVLQTRTELKSEKQTFPFSGIEIITDSSVKLSALMSNNDLTEGYYINEIGIYAVDEMEEEGEEILYSIAIANVADYFPKYNNLSPSTIIQEYYTTVDNSLQVTIQTGLAAVALAEDLLKTIERVKILENPEFDDTGITEGISSFKDFVDSVKNKMNIFQFFRNFKAGLKFIVHTGMIVDNFATKEKGFLPDATLVTALKEQLDEQNNNIDDILRVKNYMSEDLNNETFGFCYTNEYTLNTPYKEGLTTATMGVSFTGYNDTNWNTQYFMTNDGPMYYRSSNSNGYRKWSKLVLNSDIINCFKETGVSVTASTNWNDLVTAGSYSIANVSGSNAPPSAYAYGMLLVFVSGSIILQIYMPHSNSTASTHLPVHRMRYGTTWVNWRNF